MERVRSSIVLIVYVGILVLPVCSPQCKKHRELNRLKREMEGTNERLRKVQGDKVAHQYLAQFASQGTGLGGLGQASCQRRCLDAGHSRFARKESCSRSTGVTLACFLRSATAPAAVIFA